MREFGKSRKLDNVLYDVRGPVVDEAARMEENGTNVLKLNIGNPAPFGFRTPDEVIYDCLLYTSVLYSHVLLGLAQAFVYCLYCFLKEV